MLVLDVREWEASSSRKVREPLFRKSIATDRGTLTFTSVTEVDWKNRRLLLSERHTLVDEHRERFSEYQFVMHCWTRDELHTSLARSGFSGIRYFGAYDATVDAGGTDRLIAVAELTDASHAAMSSE